jgi:diacylglycerol kinase (ATP)
MSTVAVIAHAGKTFGGGLVELRRELERQGVPDPLWYEVAKSRKAPDQVKRALDGGAELLYVWGGDGMVQRCIDALDGAKTPIAIVPAGTANLFASYLEIPQDIPKAVEIGLTGRRRTLDVGRMNGERFAVMAGAGFDAQMIREADAGLKDRIGRVAYVWTGVNQLGRKPFKATIKVDGATWYEGKASSVLFGNVGELFAGVEAFEGARLDDGKLDLGVVTADSVLDWARTIARTAVGASSTSPFVRVTTARSVEVAFDRKVLYEVDGGDRKKVKKLEVEVEPAAIEVCVPAEAPAHSATEVAL